MSNVRVVVVDDSAAMRALFCDILDQAKGVDVVGTARNADEAREVVAELKPDVLTLDVEMPGMTGMEFLEEVMETMPLPVIMLSSITQAGTGTAEKALSLGAVHCFPKPLHTTPEEFSATVNQLGTIVHQAANGELPAADNSASDDSASYQSDGRIVALASGGDGIDAMREILAAYPSNCPPTVIVLDGDKDLIQNAVSAMRSAVACAIVDAEDGAMLMPGTVYLAYDTSKHVILEHPDMPQLRLVDREPVGGIRPCADLMFGSIARAGIPVIGGVLLGTGADGAKGMQMLSAAKADAFVVKPAEYRERGRFEAVASLKLDVEQLSQKEAADWLLVKSNTAASAKAEEVRPGLAA